MINNVNNLHMFFITYLKLVLIILEDNTKMIEYILDVHYILEIHFYMFRIIFIYLYFLINLIIIGLVFPILIQIIFIFIHQLK